MRGSFEHQVVIAGGGPTGLMLAAELALAGADVAVGERRPTQELVGRRAGGLHARTIEVLDQRGIAERFIRQGQTMQVAGFNRVPLDIGDFPTRHPYGLALTQNHIERILAEWVAELPVTMRRGVEVTDFTQDDDGVDVALSDGASLRARYLVGCDGGRSIVRKTAGIDFAGQDANTSWLIAEVETAEEPQWGFHQDAYGTHAIGPHEAGGAGIVLMERTVRSGEPALDDVRALLRDVYGTDFGIHSPRWISRFSDMARQAARYRDRRVLLAGDAAHVHAPIGGQGLNVGVQDAVNLGWKLGQVVAGVSPDALLDSYHAERHPVAARVLRTTMAQATLGRTDAGTKALGDIVSELVRMDGPRRRLAGEMSGLDVYYDLGEGHPLLGRRMPDLDLETEGGPARVFTLLRDARALLVDFGAAAAFDVSPWANRVRSVRARYDGAWELPVIGTVAAPGAVLVRPDGYAAWVGADSDAGLGDALVRWFGAPVG